MMKCRLCCALLGLLLGALTHPLPALAHASWLRGDPGSRIVAVVWERVTPDFRDAPNGREGWRGALLTAPGRDAGALIDRAGVAGVSSSGARAAPRALGVLLLGLAVGSVFVALRFLRPASLARVLLLGCAPAAVLAGGYLLLTEGDAASVGVARGIPIAPVRTFDETAGSRPPGRLSDEPVPDTLTGELIYAAEGRLWSLNVAGGSPVDLTPGRSRDTLAAEPALAPDGITLAFTLLALPALGAVGTPVSTPGSDVYLLDLRDGGQRRVLAHDRPAELIESPQWTPDGRVLIYGDSAPILAADGRLAGTSHTVRRLDLDTGRRTTLIEDARSPALSRDGTALAYVASNPETFVTSLWLADADGGSRRQLVGSQGSFADFLAPRFSPDGSRIVFSAAGGPGVEPPPPSPPSSSRPQRFLRWLVAPLAPPSAAAHGLPGDLWLVGRDGRGLQRLTALYEDQPIAAWSPDGRWLAILGGGGIYVVRSDGATMIRRSRTGGAGTLTWRVVDRQDAAPARP